MPNQHVLILGSGAAGVAAARALASREDVRVTLVARTGETPYIRMHIKGVAFGPTPPEMITLPLPDVEIISDTAVEVDTSAKEVQFASGARLSYDALIVATGSRPRMLPTEVGGGDAVTDAERVGSLHSLEDALRVRKLLTNLGRAARVAIYGGGVIAAGIIGQRLIVELGGTCYASGYIRAVPKVAEGGLLDVTGHLNPVRWPEAEVEGTILIAVGARYGQSVLTGDGILAPSDPTAPAGAGESAPRFRITRSGPTPTLQGPIDPAP